MAPQDQNSIAQATQVERLRVQVYPGKDNLGVAAAQRIACDLRRAAATRGVAIAVFASAPSQAEMLASLREQPQVPWELVTAFHLDEYLGLPPGDPRLFSEYLRAELFDHVPLKELHLLDPTAEPVEECRRYTELLRRAPLDVIALGIGENGHLAFNDPPVADLADPQPVKVVELDEVSRQQQVNDGTFPSLDNVPRRAITLTLPTLLSARHIHCVVPGARKRQAVEKTLYGPVDTSCPASALRTHPEATLYLDVESAPNEVVGAHEL